jgi:O-antigen biosynthesis protein
MNRTAIICPTFNNDEYTIKCFDSILNNTNDYVLIWVDNNSDIISVNNVFSYFKKHKNKFFIRNDKNYGFVKAVNIGIKKAIKLSCKEICIVNNDIEVYCNWLENFREALYSDEKIVCVGGISSAKHQWQYYEKVFSLLGIEKPVKDYTDNLDLANKLNYLKTNVKKVSGVAFFCTLFKSNIFNEIGLLSEDYGVGLGDDVDFCKRIKLHGNCCALSLNTYIHHNHRTTFNSLYDEKQIDEIKNKHKKILKNKFKNENNFIEWQYE